MPLGKYIALGSNTTVKTGPGRVYNVLAGGLAPSGGGVFVVDSVSIGATPNYVTLPQSVPSNLAHIGPLPATAFFAELGGIPFQDGLTVAATSNANVLVTYD